MAFLICLAYSGSSLSRRTSRERGDLGTFLRKPLATQFSICSATAETEERSSARMISR